MVGDEIHWLSSRTAGVPNGYVHEIYITATALLPIIAGYQLPPDKIQIDIT